MHLRFAASENTFDHFHATKAYLAEWDKPIAFYSDKHGVFRTTDPSEKDRTSGPTQFGRALYELNINIICANTPQAKGVRGTGKPDAAGSIGEGVAPAPDQHGWGGERLCSGVHSGVQHSLWQGAAQPEGYAPFPGGSRESGRRGAMSHKEARTLLQTLRLRYDKVLFILDPTDLAKRLAGKKVVVYDYPDGGLEIVHEGTALSYRTFDKLRSVNTETD